jgi:hypothetical protein
MTGRLPSLEDLGGDTLGDLITLLTLPLLTLPTLLTPSPTMPTSLRLLLPLLLKLLNMPMSLSLMLLAVPHQFYNGVLTQEPLHT